MNTLRFQLEELFFEESESHWSVRMFAGDQELNEKYAIDWINLTKSALLPGGYFILTCGCGDPGCAGIDEPVSVFHKGSVIGWNVIDPKPERLLRFDKDQYRIAILKLLKEASLVVPYSEDSMTYRFGHYGFTSKNLDWCIRTLETGIIEGTGYEQ
jgi:hypothetical protein